MVERPSVPSTPESPPELTEHPAVEPAPAGGLERAIATAGQALVGAGRFVGAQVAGAYRAIDPDLRRHVAQLPLLGYSLIGSRRAVVEPGTPDGHPPVVFVHGLGGSRGDFLLMAGYLHLYGRKRSYRVQFDSKDPLEQRARALAGFIAEVVSVTGEPTVDVVAHSLGGLVIRLALRDPEVASAVRAVLTLGTPHGGTHAARFGNTPTLRELRPDSELIRLLADTPWPAEVRGVSCWSRSDMMVLPPESAALAGTEQLEVTPFTHYSYLIDPRCWVLVRNELERSRA